jgi:hypothetical protein
MADVRKDGRHYVTLRRIYRDKKVGFGRTLLFPQGARLEEKTVKEHGLEVEAPEVAPKPAPKGRKAK